MYSGKYIDEYNEDEIIIIMSVMMIEVDDDEYNDIVDDNYGNCSDDNCIEIYW